MTTEIITGPDQANPADTAVALINPPAAWVDVLAERQRQVAAEHHLPDHDDRYVLGELGLAAALCAIPYEAEIVGEKLIEQDDHIALDMALEIACGWAIKPEPDVRRRKVKAAALLIAAHVPGTDQAARAGAGMTPDPAICWGRDFLRAHVLHLPVFQGGLLLLRATLKALTSSPEETGVLQQ